MMDYTRFLTAEVHLGKFPDPTEFRSWKVNFKTVVCAKTADPQITMHWITEVEKALSFDELMTSQSILGRRDFPDDETPDVLIASSLKKLARQIVLHLISSQIIPSQLACSLPQKSKCQRAACTKT